MCEFFSAIVTRDGRVLFCEDDSHETIIERAGLKDDKLNDRDLVRIECIGGLIKNYKEDEPSTLPKWYDRNLFKPKIEAILSLLKPAWDEYKKIQLSAYKKYMSQQVTWADFIKIQEPAFEEYKKKISKIEGYVGGRI